MDKQRRHFSGADKVAQNFACNVAQVQGVCNAMQLRHAKRGKGGRGCDGGQLLNLS